MTPSSAAWPMILAVRSADALSARREAARRAGTSRAASVPVSCILLLAMACPDCPPAREARSLVFSDTLWLNVGYAVLPFIVVALIVRWFVAGLDGDPTR